MLATAATYTNDFSGTGGNTAFPNETTDAEWTATGGVYRYTTTNTSFTASTASVAVAGVGGSPFTIETQFTVTSVGATNSNGATIGLAALGASTGFSGTASSSAYYLADWQVSSSGTAGNLRILAQGDVATGFTSNAVTVDDNIGSAGLSVILGATYTLRLVGTYEGSTLNMTLGVFDANGQQIGASATASDTTPLTGTNFGYRNRVGQGSGTFSADFDNFSVIPEPSSMVMLSLGATMAVLVRRRPVARA